MSSTSVLFIRAAHWRSMYRPLAASPLARADIIGVGIAIAKDIRAVGQRIAHGEVYVHQIVQITVFGFAAVLLDILAQGVQGGEGFKKVGVPFWFRSHSACQLSGSMDSM